MKLKKNDMIQYLFLKLVLVSTFFTIASCSSSKVSTSNVPLGDTKWILKTLNDKKIFIPESSREVHIEFKFADSKFNGYGGCNTFSGTYTNIKNKLKLGPIARTEMYCEAMMDVENNFMSALAKTVIYKIRGNILELYDANNLLATLVKI